MKPKDLGLPARFKSWRPGQLDAVMDAAADDKRFVALAMPTGSGKSAVYMAIAHLMGRTAILTSTKGLQDQLMREFKREGLAEVRGQNNYTCRLEAEAPRPRTVTVDEGPCHFGVSCEYRTGGCTYYDAVRIASMRKTEVVVTNYSFWMNIHQYGEGLGQFDALVLDEAHAAPDELSDFLGVEFTQDDFEEIGMDLPPASPAEWPVWAARWHLQLTMRLDAMKKLIANSGYDAYTLRMLKKTQVLATKMARVSFMQEGTAVSETVEVWGGRRKHRHVKFGVVTPAAFAEQHLFKKIPKVIFTSATIRPKTLELLGVAPEDHTFREYESPFPRERSPIIYIPTVRVDHKSSDDDLRVWIDRIDQIIDRRMDRKGLIHTVSYKRKDLLMLNSRHKRLLVDHSRREAASVLAAFRHRKPPAVLVSPAMTTGVDLPYEDCEYIIIAKVPFIDTRSALMQARCAQDKTLSNYLTAVELVQAAGRGMRAVDDWCEVFIIDDHISWFYPRNRKFFPMFFRGLFDTSYTVPRPIPRGKR